MTILGVIGHLQIYFWRSLSKLTILFCRVGWGGGGGGLSKFSVFFGGIVWIGVWPCYWTERCFYFVLTALYLLRISSMPVFFFVFVFLFLLDGRKWLFTFTGQYNCRYLFRKINPSKISFQKRFSSIDHLNVITRTISIYFDYIVTKTRRNNGHHKASTVARVPADIGKTSLKQLYLS